MRSLALVLLMTAMVLFSIWLRQPGASPSKPVGEAHGSTASQG